MPATDAQAPPPPWHSLAAGASSAVISRLCTYPPDTVKARLQVQGAGGTSLLYHSTFDAFAKIAAREGVSGFYRGFGGILLTVIPANCCYFSGYEFGKRIAPKGGGLAADLTAALTAQTVAGVAFCPIDIVKQRVQTQQVLSPGSPTSPLKAVREVYGAAGLAGFYKGYWAMNALWLPWNLVYIPLYEAAKRRVYRWQLGRLRQRGVGAPAESTGAGGVRVLADPPMLQVLPLWSFPLCSALCSATASIVTHPIDVVKTRLQVLSNRAAEGKASAAAESGGGGSGAGAAAQRRLTAWQVCRQLYVGEGLLGFTRGMGARVVTMSTGSAVTWLTYEGVKRGLERWDHAQHAQHALGSQYVQQVPQAHEMQPPQQAQQGQHTGQQAEEEPCQGVGWQPRQPGLAGAPP